MKILLILRHAKSDLGSPDHARPLNLSGQKTAPQVGKLLINNNIIPDLIICSSAQRAQETMNLLIKSSGFENSIIVEPDLYGTSAADYTETIKQHCKDYNCIMTIGHNPTCEELIYCLTDRHEHLPAATLVELTLNIESWQELQTTGMKAKIQNIWRPKELD